MHIILASSSPARNKQLSQLGLPFEVIAPEINETPKPKETAKQLVSRLSQAKANKIAQQYPNSWVIGCDQVAVFQDKIYGKPYQHRTALETLNRFSGQMVTSLTGLCLMNQSQQVSLSAIESYQVVFRSFTNQQADQYLRLEQPYYSAGSINIDGLGISLIAEFKGRDYNSLIGLPLIQLIDLFTQAGIDIVQARAALAP